MPTEIEAKFLHVEHQAVRSKLEAVGATLVHPMRLMRRDMFDYPDGRYRKGSSGEKLRIRDEGDRSTFTYKRRSGGNYPYEVETTVGSYEATKQLLEAIGLQVYSHQESKRETWHLNDVEVVLDEWPWLDPYIEIEGPSEAAIKAAAEDLGFGWADAHFGSVDVAYRDQYARMTNEDSIGEVSVVAFDAELPQYLKDRT